VPSWAANRVLPVPPPGGSRDRASDRDGDSWLGGLALGSGSARSNERDIMIELD
jgi:hypothetical protein